MRKLFMCISMWRQEGRNLKELSKAADKELERLASIELFSDMKVVERASNWEQANVIHDLKYP